MYHCDYCRRDISQLVRIKCAECADFVRQQTPAHRADRQKEGPSNFEIQLAAGDPASDWRQLSAGAQSNKPPPAQRLPSFCVCASSPFQDLCLECFQAGHHIAPHEPDHAYRVVHNVKSPLWSEEWGADEELLLLEALEMFGMGNWSDVADHVGSKSKTQCESHYDQVYCSNKQLLPDPAKALTRRSQHTKQEGDDAEGGVKIEGGKDAKNAAAAAVGSSSSAVALPASSTSGKPMAKAHAVTKPKPKSGLGHLVGFTPNRGDFDTEYENDAELVLADMEFKEEDSKWERDLKLKVLEIYNSRLDARMERKKFILERNLLERKEKKRAKEEREINNNMRVFAKFHSAEQHEAFVQGLANEQRLRKRIEQLQNYRLNGIRSLADGELFEAEKRKRDAQLGNKKSGGGAFDAPGSGMGGKTTGKKRSAAEAAEEDRLNKARKDTAGKGPSLTASAAAVAAAGFGAAPGASTVPEWDVSKFPGMELLSSQEKQLCATLQILPQHYLMIKERLIREVRQNTRPKQTETANGNR